MSYCHMSVHSTQSRSCTRYNCPIHTCTVCDSMLIACQIQINSDKLEMLVPCHLCNVSAVLFFDQSQFKNESSLVKYIITCNYCFLVHFVLDVQNGYWIGAKCETGNDHACYTWLASSEAASFHRFDEPPMGPTRCALMNIKDNRPSDSELFPWWQQKNCDDHHSFVCEIKLG